MEKVVTSHPTTSADFGFRPELEISAITDAREMKQAAAFLLRVLPNDVDKISAAVAAEWGAIQEKLPPTHLPTVSDGQRQEFLQTRYCDIVAQVIATRPANSTTHNFEFVPQILPSDISDADERASATA